MPDPDLLATDDGKTRYASYFSTLETECGHWGTAWADVAPARAPHVWLLGRAHGDALLHPFS
jgi:hypothetical protein